MILKFIGGALIISAGIVLGNSCNAVYCERLNVLERFHSFVIFCESEINYYRTELGTIIEKFKANGQKTDDIIFNNKTSINISPECRKLIDGFFRDIPTLDSDTQQYFFNKTKTETTQAIIRAKSDIINKGKMLKKLLPIISIGIFILFL